MDGKLIFTPEEFQEAAVKYRQELLMLPIIGCNDTLQYMTARPGIRYKENVGEINASTQFAPYNPSRTGYTDLKLNYRTLETFLGSCVTKFHPNSAISTILGKGATKGDGQMHTPTAKLVLALIARSLSEHLNNAIWSAKRDAEGDTTMDLFDGFDTITAAEVTAGNIAASKGNYMEIATPTDANAEDIAKSIMRNLDPRLRALDLNFYCSQDFVDSYNECYQNNHGALPYNNRYNQTCIEGSNGRIKFVPLFNKADSKYIHIAPQSNMLVGYDQMGDVESVEVEKYEPYLLTYVATMFFGCQFESIDKRRLMVAEIKP